MMPILILAAGGSTRMRGTDKLMQDIDGVPLLRRVAAMALGVSDDVRVTLPVAPHPRHDAIADLSVQRIEVVDAASGISASLRAGFGTLEPGVSHAMVVLGDLPDIGGDDLRAVMDACLTHPDALVWRGATPSGAAGHPMIFARPLFKALEALQGDTGGQSVIAKAGDAVHLVRFDDDRARRDLDTPEAWAAWRAARAGPSTSDGRR